MEKPSSEHLPSKHEALNSPQYRQKKKKKVILGADLPISFKPSVDYSLCQHLYYKSLARTSQLICSIPDLQNPK
jgi:hypothetical protein